MIMDKTEIESKVKEIFERGAKASKSAFEKAGTKVQDFSDKSVVKIDIKKLQAKQTEKYKEIGELISKMLEDGAEIQFENQEKKELLMKIQAEIQDISNQIKEKQEKL